MSDFNEKYWSDELARAADHERERGFQEAGEQSIKLYEAKEVLDDCSRKMSIWWMVNQTILPAYYSRKPKVEAVLRKKRGPQPVVLGARIIEGASQYAIDNHFDFDDVAIRAVLQFLLVGRASLWVKFDANFNEAQHTIALLKDDSGAYTFDDGRPYDGEEEPEVGEDGFARVTKLVSEVKKKRVSLIVPHWKDYRVGVGRDHTESEWRAKRAYMGRAAVAEMFGKDVASAMKYDVDPTSEKGADSKTTEKKAEIWEIHCKKSGKVYWLNNSGSKSVIESSEPPIKFEGFYPCVEISQNISLDSVVPIGDFVELKDMLTEAERLTTRIHATTQAIRANLAADPTVAEDLEKLMTTDLMVHPVRVLSKPISESVWPAPIEPYVSALQQLIQSRELVLSKIYEATGASDLVRGMTNPLETATAQEIKSQFTNLRFGLRQRLVIDFFGQAIGKVGEALAQTHEPEELIEMSNMIADITDTNLLQQAVAVIKSDEERSFSLQVASDSMVAVDEQADRKMRVELLQSAGTFMQQMETVLQSHPTTAPVAMKLLEFTVRSYRNGKELEESFEQMFAAIAQEVQAKYGGQQPQPGAMEAQAKMQIAQMEMQVKQAQIQLEQTRMQMEMQNAQAEHLLKLEALKLDRFRAELEAQVANTEAAIKAEQLRLDQFRAQNEAGVAQGHLQLQSKEVDTKASVDAVNTAVDTRMKQIEARIETQKLVLDKERVQLEMYEKLLEERRLSLQNLGTPKPKTGKITRDEKGNSTVEIS